MSLQSREGSLRHGGGGALLGALWLAMLAGCPDVSPVLSNGPAFGNESEPTNAGAAFVGSASCRQCHSAISDRFDLNAHGHALTAVSGAAPAFPEGADRGGVPDPPGGLAWTDVSYVVGGFAGVARFLDRDGFVLTDGRSGFNTQWNPAFPLHGSSGAFAPFMPDRVEPLAFDFDRFARRATGAMRQDEASPRFQDSRPGIPGTWSEAGVQCEACHGPGSNHFSTRGSLVLVDQRRVFVDSAGTDSCRGCHGGARAGDADDAADDVIEAANGFVRDDQQWSELRASRGHAHMRCTTCHDPHRSLTYDRARAIRNECIVCHRDATMAGHDGAMFERGDYREVLSCESCHMPYAGLRGARADASVVGAEARVGDTRTHIFRIDVASTDADGMFDASGDAVTLDADGHAAVTTNFVCLRCHNGNGAFELTYPRATEIAGQVHRLPP
jgi:hypothetical protein